MDKKNQQRERLFSLLKHDDAAFQKWNAAFASPIEEFMEAYIEYRVIHGFTKILETQYFGYPST